MAGLAFPRDITIRVADSYPNRSQGSDLFPLCEMGVRRKMHETVNNVGVIGLLLDQLYSVSASTEVRMHGLI